jgi:hypothetical protein
MKLADDWIGRFCKLMVALVLALAFLGWWTR